ncbi:MAG: CubicO group peptidase (beta-lactamase class C family) [Candidatus Latescibacterota bacterium]|jgi:CubicO group peptidase (beta-lactamase class C family)
MFNANHKDEYPDTGLIDQYAYPPAGHDIDLWKRAVPGAVGLDAEVISELDACVKANPDNSKRREQRWALWRNGYLIDSVGEFHDPINVASLRKTWHAMILGASILNGKVSSYDQKVSEWQTDMEGHHREATWRHVITQSAGLDYPYGDYPAFKPGEMWTYSDLNLVHFCHAMGKVYGKADFYDDYADVAKQAYFDAIGMQGWDTKIVFDSGSQMDDGVRFVIDLDHMGRLGLLALARGRWMGQQLVPRWFVEELETKQTEGMQVNYVGPNDGICHLNDYPNAFPECPYGYLTWTNSAGEHWSDADRGWAFGAGAGGTYIMWNYRLGIVFAAVSLDLKPLERTIPQIIESHILGDNPLVVL